MKKALIFALLIGSCAIGYSQSRKSDFVISGGAVGGILMPHHEPMRYLVDGHILAAELNIFKRGDGSKDWHHWYNFPTWGLAINQFDFGSDKLGWGTSALLGLGLDLDQKRRIQLKLGIGIGYVQKPYDQDDNFQQTAIGSHLNAALSVGVHTRIGISEHWYLEPGIAVHHFSNGAFKTPNAGINMALLKLNIVYDGSAGINPPREAREPDEKIANVLIGVTFGLKQTIFDESTRYPAGNFFGIWQKRITPKTSLGGELGLNYNSSLEARLENIDEPASSADNYRAYIAAHHVLHFDPFAFRFQVGSYLWPSFKEDGMVFFRYHLIYQMERIDLFAGLKSHFAKADNAEIGLAYKLR